MPEVCKARGFREPLTERYDVIPGGTYVAIHRYVHTSDDTVCLHEVFQSVEVGQ
jgi:hypothetical protein